MSDQTFPLTYDYSQTSDGGADGKAILLNGLGLKPGWYGLDVWIVGDNALVSANAIFANSLRPNLRIRLEPAGSRHFKKTLKTSEIINSINILADGLSAKGLARIEIKPLNGLDILKFLIGKGIRYILANRNRLSFSLIMKQVRAAIRPNASFAFRANYAAHKDNDASYAVWRELHEDTHAGRNAAASLDKILGERRLEVAVLMVNGLDSKKIFENIKTSLISTRLNITPIDIDDFIKAPIQNMRWNFVFPWDREGELAEGAFERLALSLIDNPELDAVFADSDHRNPDGTRTAPRLKPAWDQELLWCGDYIRAPLLVRWNANLIGPLTGQDASVKPSYALALNLLATRKREKLSHIPEILFHETAAPDASAINLERRILAAHLQQLGNPSIISERPDGILRIDWPACANATVSIIIPTKDSPDLLKNCIDSIHQRTIGPLPEIIVADNGSVRPETKALFGDLLRQGLAKVIPCPGPFNFSKINNDARRHATGDVIVLLNDDTQVISPDWLTELASLAMRAEIGAVGSLLLYPDGTVQHAGIVLGIGGGIADHAFRYFEGDSPGYLNLLRSRREVSAVTGACLAVSAKNFDLIGGLDETLPVTLNDVDFCLRLRDRGLINIWTPWAILEHWESKSRGIDHTEVALRRQAKEVRIFSERWGDLIDRDPNYHQGLNDSAPDFHLAI